MCLRSKPRHIFDYAEYRYIDFVSQEHIDTLAGIGQRHFLRSRDNDHTGDGKCLHQRKVDVTGAWRHIYKEIVEFSPVGIAYELPESVGRH